MVESDRIELWISFLLRKRFRIEQWPHLEGANSPEESLECQ
jgi:hypothetical protein